MTSHDHQTLPRRLVTNHLLLVVLSYKSILLPCFLHTSTCTVSSPTDTCMSQDILSKISSQFHLGCKKHSVSPGVQGQAVIV